MPLNAEQIGALSRLLDQALPLSPTARQAWLDALPAESAPLVPALRRALSQASAGGASTDLLSTGNLAPERLMRALPLPAGGALRAGQRIGAYELIREIGAGGMAVVWLARGVEVSVKGEVALKLPVMTRVRPDLVQRLTRERGILARLRHPHIARLHDAGVTADGVPFLAMEFVEGRTLDAWCDEHRLNVRERLKVFLQVLDAVGHAHDRGVVHRDLKPSNILVSPSGHARLLDFGIATLIDTAGGDGNASDLTARFGPLMTVAYASPEQVRGEPAGAASDIYSLGVILYELLCGSRPYSPSAYQSPLQLLRESEAHEIREPSANVAHGAGRGRGSADDDLKRALCGDLDAIAIKALAGPIAERYAGVSEFAADLRAFLEGFEASNARSAMPLARRRTNLPARIDSLIGRRADIDALLDLVVENRLVTVAGPGGAGKTRLAQAVAHRIVPRFANGVWWVDLATQSSGDHLAATIAAAANLQIGTGDAREALLRSLSTRDMLIVLDNCEHLVDAVARLSSDIVQSAGRVHLLATSQAATRASGERVYTLDGLAVPAESARPDDAVTYGSLRLLEQRVQAADRHFRLTVANLPDAIRLCAGLDGLPLAIEMAAARVARLGLANVVARLDERLQLLRSAARGVPPRHDTMRAVLDWSHSLLEPVESTVLRRLSVFAGNFRLESAQWVASQDDIGLWDVVDAIGALVDKSLVKKLYGEPTRYRLLETTRLYAMERMRGAGEQDATRRRHGQAMIRLAEQMERDRLAMPESPWLLRYSPDYDDLDSAFEFAATIDDAEVIGRVGEGLRAIDSLLDVRPKTDRRAEVAYRLTRVLGERAPPQLWGLFLGNTRLRRVTSESPLALAAEAVAAGQRHSADDIVHLALLRLASEYAMTGDFESSDLSIAKARDLERPDWPAAHRIRRQTFVTLCAQLKGDAASVRDSSKNLISLAEDAGAIRVAAWARLTLAEAAMMDGDIPEAIAQCTSACAEFEALDQPRNLSLALMNLTASMLLGGDQSGAWRAACRLPSVIGHSVDWGYECLALLFARRGNFELSAQIVGYLRGWYATHSRRAEPTLAKLALLAEEIDAGALGVGEFERLRLQGAALPPDEIRDRIRAALRC